jgi:putative NADH-flavin reductase
MKVLLIGATGRVGRPVLRELLSRGHSVTAFARDPGPLADELPAVETVAGDAFDAVQVGAAIGDHDVLISSVALRDDAQRTRTPIALTRTLAGVAAQAGVRWVSLGGAGSLRTASGVDLVDTPEFPAVAAAESRGFRDALHELLDHAPAGLAWTVVSPPALIVFDGIRTGNYRMSQDTLLLNDEGRSTISVADLAVAVVDEVESGAHVAARFGVGY